MDKEIIADWIQKAHGSNPSDLENFVRWQKFNYHVFWDWGSERKKIKYFLSQGYPVIVTGKISINSTGHMIVLVGYDDSKSRVRQAKPYQGAFFALDPAAGKEIELDYTRFKEFHSGWGNYCLVIYKPTN